MKKRGKKAQLDLSFGMIFSIILIIAFVGFGIFIIIKVIGWQEDIQIQQFLSDFSDDVKNMWNSREGSQQLTYSLPGKITAICLINDDYGNLIFRSKGTSIIPGKNVDYLDIASITAKENPYCIGNIKGKVSLTLVKDFGENLVRVER